MKTKLVFFLTVIAAVLIPQLLFAQTYQAEWSFNRMFQHILSTQDSQEISFTKKELRREQKKEQDTFAVYEVSKSKITKDGKTIKDPAAPIQKIWEMFSAISGNSAIKTKVQKFATYEGPFDPVLGFTLPLTKQGNIWGVALNVKEDSIGDRKIFRDQIITMLHEFGHILTLNSKQVNFLENKGKSCSKILSQLDSYQVAPRMCSKAESYINEFVKKFWSDHDTKQMFDSNRIGAAERFYGQHPTDFVTKYAITSPNEDIAESFTDFILRAKPLPDSFLKSDQKILFFYSYPELVDLRNSIRPKIQEYFVN